MQPLVAMLLGAVLAGLCPGTAGGGAAPALPLLSPDALDPVADRLLERTVVPDAARRVGEVRLLERGNAAVVQTLLLTKVLGRAIAEIRAKETANWPPGSEGRDAMHRYVAALERTAAQVRAEREAAGGDDRRDRLLIEFVLTPTAAGVHLATFTGEERHGAIEPVARRPLETLALERHYVLVNMRLILADAFDHAGGDLRQLRLPPLLATAIGPARP